MKLPYVAIEMDRLGGPEVAATWGQPGGPPVRLPLVHDGEMAGRLIVASGAQSGTRRPLGKVRRELELAVADVRNLVDALQPTPLDQLGLVAALQEAAARFSTAAAGPASADEGLLAMVEAPDDLPRLPAAVELAAYRIATEALTNTARHARARHCWIRLACNGTLNLEVADDGTGVHHPSASGVGLHSMRERAAELVVRQS
jgi:two-component system, NarL family, sensor kinase